MGFSERNPKCSRSSSLLCTCVCAHQHSLGMLKVRTSGCGSICLINGAVMEWELGISALQWKRTSCRRLPCADKSSPATSASRTQRPGTNPVLHLCTVPYRSSITLSSLSFCHTGLESKEQTHQLQPRPNLHYVPLCAPLYTHNH